MMLELQPALLQTQCPRTYYAPPPLAPQLSHHVKDAFGMAKPRSRVSSPQHGSCRGGSVSQLRRVMSIYRAPKGESSHASSDVGAELTREYMTKMGSGMENKEGNGHEMDSSGRGEQND